MCIRDRRIGELLESGQFASNVELAEAASSERSLDVYKRQDSALVKLQAMSEAEFAELELYPDFDQ